MLGLERCAGELVNEIMSIIEEGDEDAELQLLLRGTIPLCKTDASFMTLSSISATLVFPSFSDLFQQLKDADREFSAQCMSHWTSFIKGPPNKPNKDNFGLMPVSLNCQFEIDALASNF